MTVGTRLTTRETTIGSGRLCWDELNPDDADTSVLVLPGFGRTADEMFLVTALLAHHGHRVACPDFRNQAGRSSGDAYGHRLSQQVEDIGVLLERCEPASVLATSLSMRAAMRAVMQAGWSGRLIGLLPVVSPVATLAAVTGYDWNVAEQASWPKELVLDGTLVSSDLLRDAVDHHLAHIDDTVADARSCALTLLASPVDTWVEIEDVQRVARATGGTVIEINGSHHDFARSFRRARSVFQLAADAVACRQLKQMPIGALVRARAELRETGWCAMLGGGS